MPKTPGTTPSISPWDEKRRFEGFTSFGMHKTLYITKRPNGQRSTAQQRYAPNRFLLSVHSFIDLALASVFPFS